MKGEIIIDGETIEVSQDQLSTITDQIIIKNNGQLVVKSPHGIVRYGG